MRAIAWIVEKVTDFAIWRTSVWSRRSTRLNRMLARMHEKMRGRQ
jgi:hypothetical protein